MIPIVAGLLLLWLGSSLLREFVRANPAVLARRVKQGGGVVVLLAALFLLLRGEVGVALGLAGLGFWLTTGRQAPLWRDFGGPKRRRLSRVRSALIAMELDHATGHMTGEVLAGPLAGRALGSLPVSDVYALRGLCLTADPEGARLLEAYLDRRAPGWRLADQHEGDAWAHDGTGQRSGPSSAMSEDAAYQLLGLQKGASREEITRAHRALMKKCHPDHGGSTDMAARVNAAKDVLMRRHP